MHLSKVIKLLKPNDYVIINMIHKDEKSEIIFEGLVADVPSSLLKENNHETKETY